MLAGGECVVGRPNSGEAALVGGDDLFGCFPPADSPLQEEIASSDEAGARRRWCGAGKFTSGERMLAGGECVVGGRTPAKPRWSEVIILLDVLLRQTPP